MPYRSYRFSQVLFWLQADAYTVIESNYWILYLQLLRRCVRITSTGDWLFVMVSWHFRLMRFLSNLDLAHSACTRYRWACPHQDYISGVRLPKQDQAFAQTCQSCLSLCQLVMQISICSLTCGQNTNFLVFSWAYCLKIFNWCPLVPLLNWEVSNQLLCDRTCHLAFKILSIFQSYPLTVCGNEGLVASVSWVDPLILS